MAELTNYQCNVQGPKGEKNLGCQIIFASKDNLAPRERLCPDCRKTVVVPEPDEE